MSDPNPSLPPPPRAGAGCLGVGCMAFVAFFLFLVVAFIGGGAWAIHHLRNHYSSKTPLELPVVETTSRVATLQPSATPVAMPENSTAVPTTTVAPIETSRTAAPTESAQQRWDAFEKASKRGKPAHIELTAGEINSLISAGKKTRGKAFVQIENNVLHLTVSVPLNDIVFMNGRFLNAAADIQSAPDGDPAKAKITNVRIGSEAVADDFLDRRLFGWSSLRGYIRDWLENQNATNFRIEENRVVGDAGG